MPPSRAARTPVGKSLRQAIIEVLAGELRGERVLGRREAGGATFGLCAAPSPAHISESAFRQIITILQYFLNQECETGLP
jgi:hypothetical protein